ncbi:MAG TPA: flavodoxin family protein [Spirochaetia bacterium]|nr:flavodoxin family protein [Spirochaetia bacterium]
MRILAVNGSPRGKAGNTECILQPFLVGAREAGAEAETIYLKDKKIEHCRGCFSCWTKTPGTCVHKDDMPELLAKLRPADVLVLASPLYVFTVSGLMKDFLDRMLPLADPHMIKQDGRFVHLPRYGEDRDGDLRKVVLISNCGFPERHHFTGLVETFRLLTWGLNACQAASILCAGGELLRVEQLQESIRWYLEAARAAGREFGQTGCICPATQETLDRSLADPEVYAQKANAYWDSLIARPGDQTGNCPEPEGNGLVSLAPVVPEKGRLPLSFREAVAGQAGSFNIRAAGDLRADIQFRATGAEAGDFVLRIKGGHCEAYEGMTPARRLT